jgi:hypothetical protein
MRPSERHRSGVLKGWLERAEYLRDFGSDPVEYPVDPGHALNLYLERRLYLEAVFLFSRISVGDDRLLGLRAKSAAAQPEWVSSRLSSRNPAWTRTRFSA